MQLTIAQPDLAKALGIASRAVSSRAPSAALHNLHLDARDGRLTVTGNNLEMGIATSAAATVTTEGAILAPAKLFGDLVASLPNQPVTLHVDDKRTLHVACGTAKAKLSGMDPDDFPPMPNVDAETAATVPAHVLRTAIQQVVFAAATDESRPVLTGVLVEIANGQLRLTAADGYRLAHRVIDGVQGQGSALVPARVCQELARLLGGTDDLVTIAMSESPRYASVRVGETTVASSLIEGQFPNYRQIIPKAFRAWLTVGVADLMVAAKRAGLFATKGAAYGVTLRGDPEAGRLRVATMVGIDGDAESEIDAEIAIEPREGESATVDQPLEIEWRLNYHYLVDALGGIEAERVAIGYNSASSPVLLRPVCAEPEHYEQIVMTVYKGGGGE